MQQTTESVARHVNAVTRLRRQLPSHFAQHVEYGAEIWTISWVLKKNEGFDAKQK
jgi:hypothetical protein